jgi:hypothetical protein
VSRPNRHGVGRSMAQSDHCRHVASLQWLAHSSKGVSMGQRLMTCCPPSLAFTRSRELLDDFHLDISTQQT